MALILKDRVQETSTTTGTGTLTLAGAVTQFQTFSSAIGNGNTTYYTIYNAGGSDWEVGIGTVGAGTLARTTVLASSNAGSLVNFTGTLYVFCDYPATKAVYANASNQIHVDGNSYIDFESAPGTTVAAGRMWYDNTFGTWNLGMGGGNITQQVGEELFVYGKASATISDSPLRIVYQTGVVGASGQIEFGPTVAGITDGNLILGCATESITSGNFGRITSYGIIHGITTNGTAYGETWADGDVIWYNPVTGNPTKNKPAAPNIKVQLGIITHAGNGGSGSFFVLVNPGSVLGGTDSNVQITSASAAQILTYDSSDQYWKNTSLASGTGISTTTNANGTLTVNNTAPDQTVSLTAGTGISVTGTYPSFTVANTGVTSVTGTAPVVSSGGATPAISLGTVGIANGGTGLTSVGSSGQILASNGTGLVYSNRTQYLGVLLNTGSTTQVPTSNGYIGILLNTGSTTQVPIS